MDFPSRLKYLRKAKRLSQKELGDMLGVTSSASAISKYEKGINVPPSDKLALLAEIFDVSTDYLLGLSDDPERHQKPAGNSAKAPAENYIYIMGANGRREKITIPPDKAERVKKLLETAFPEMMEE